VLAPMQAWHENTEAEIAQFQAYQGKLQASEFK
jgi:hypothetical protein